MGARTLRITPPADPTPPPDRGRLMTPEQVATEMFQGHVRRQWVLRNVTPKVRFGYNTILYYERDVREWIEAHRQGAA